MEAEAEQVGVNEVTLRGRVSAAPQARELPSGASITTFRVVVPRAPTPMTRGSSARSDWFDCTAWSARARRAVATWEVGDQVEVRGSVRRRHYRGGVGVASIVEVEVVSARRAAMRPAAS